MQAQLQSIRDELLAAQERLHRLARSVPAERWAVRTDPARWSVAECVEHLNLTSAAFERPVTAALAEGRKRPPVASPASVRYRRDPLGWLLWKVMGPPVRFRVPTTAAFLPTASVPPAQLVASFDEWQAKLLGWVEQAEGLPIDKLRVTSPFSGKTSYNLYSSLSILPRHQHRHLWQAERVWE